MRQKPRPPVDHHLAGLLVSRGRLHAHQYLQTRDSHNLEDAISTMRKVVALVKGAQSDILGPALGNLAALLLEQFKLTGRDTALNEALQLARWALDCLSDRDADHSVLLATLGSILASQYDRLKRTQDLEDAISSLQIATRTQSPSDDGDLPAVVLNNLACVMGRRYENSGRREDLNDAITSALDATEMGLSNCPSLLAGVGSTLAGLLARQYESTGQLDSLANALFELRIVTEVEPEFPELDALLVQLGGLAKEQHALRAQPTDERIEVSQSRYPNILTVFLVFSLSPVLSLTYPGAFYPFIIFFGGIMSNWVFQKYIQPISRDERRNSLFDSVPVWIQRIFSSPYDQFSFKFAPTLFSTPWIETPSTIAFLGSDEDLHNEGRLRRRRSIHDRRFESGYDQLLRVGARNRSPAHDEDCNQGDIDGLHLGFNKSPRARLCHPSQAFPQSSRTKYYENDVERQTQLPYKHLTDSKAWDDIKDSQSDDGFLPALIVASEEGRGVNEIFQTKQPISTSSTNRRPTTENVKKTDNSYPTEGAEFLHKQETISNSVPISVGYPSTALGPLKAKSSEHTHMTPRKDLIDQKKHSSTADGKLAKKASPFDSVAQGNTSNDINKNEGNAMGNIYSEEAHVVGHLSRHYGDRFETKNISAILRERQTPHADHNSVEAALDNWKTKDTLKETIPPFIPGLDKQAVQERIRKQQEIPQDREARDEMQVDSTKVDFRDEPRPLQPESWTGFGPSLFGPQSDRRSTELETQRESEWLEGFEDLQDLRVWPERLNRNRQAEDGTSLFAVTVDSDHSGTGAPLSKARRKRDDREPTPPRVRGPQYDRSRNTRVDESSDKLDSPSEVSLIVHPNYRMKRSTDKYGSNSLPDSGRRQAESEAAARNHNMTSRKPTRRTNERTFATLEGTKGGNPTALPVPNLKNFATSLEKVRALSSYFEDSLLPVCNSYLVNLPADPKRRKLEHAKLSETILNHVLLGADSIDVEDETTRAMRRRLIEDAQWTLDRIDETQRD